MPLTDHLVVRLVIALSIGLLIGAERERRKRLRPFTRVRGTDFFARFT
jgi:hypothetical protein